MEILLVIPTVVVVALAVVQGGIQIYLARRGERGRSGGKVAEAICWAFALLVILSIESMAWKMALVVVYFFCSCMVSLYVEGKIQGQGTTVVKRKLPMILVGTLLLAVFLWGVQRLFLG